MKKAIIASLFGIVAVFAILYATLPPILHVEAKTVQQNTDTVLLSEIDQMLMIGFRGSSFKDAKNLQRILSKTNVGGIILFDFDSPSKSYGRNIGQNRRDLKQMLTDIQKNSKTPIFIGIDEEGGKVSRLKRLQGYQTTSTAFTLGTKSPSTTLSTASTIGSYLYSLGVNMNFAPVVDLHDPRGLAIGNYGRAFSNDPYRVIEHARAFKTGLEINNVIPVLKHYPGHGSARSDTHRKFTDVTKYWKETEMLPFSELCGEVPAVMVAHIVNQNIDSLPASLSAKHIANLRNIAGCSEVLVISDDYDMRAITSSFKQSEVVIRAITAGVDLLVFSNNIGTYDPNKLFEIRTAIYRAVESGHSPRQRITQSFNRIQKLKREYKIIK